MTYIKPMLAHKLTERRKFEFPFYVQPKLNGIRAIWDGEKLWSRDGKQFHTLRHIVDALPPGMPFDGELYIHGYSLQQINGIAAVNRTTPHAKVLSLKYHIFDSPQNELFSKRLMDLTDACFEQSYLEPVPTFLVNSTIAEEASYTLFKKQRYEGAIYRDANAIYGFAQNCGNQENRWATLLKRKDWLDMDCVIVGIKEGKGQFQGKVGALEFKTPDGKTFFAGSGLNFRQREIFFTAPPIGKIAKLNYEMLSDGGTPLKPTIESIV